MACNEQVRSRSSATKMENFAEGVFPGRSGDVFWMFDCKPCLTPLATAGEEAQASEQQGGTARLGDDHEH